MTPLALSFLGYLERRETALLAWGYVDASFDREELDAAGDEFVLEHDDTGLLAGTDVIDDLLARGLVLEVDTGDRVVLRTRMAETIRLLARLRQLFPRHGGGAWSQAPTLVSDYRLLVRPRSYPRRNITARSALETLRDAGVIDGQRADAVETLLTQRGDDFCLARFQLEAALHILQALDGRRSGGTIVGAGTGSGKTLAFYLPALSYIAADPHRTGTRVLAVYPRIELLRDQFAETYLEARRLDQVHAPPVRLGTLYGATPFTPHDVPRVWSRRGDAFICPYLVCPTCGEPLLWTDPDREARRERLECSACEQSIGEDEIVLTRSRLLESPADVLFLTSEMLNRSLADTRYQRLVGVGDDPMPIDLVLLDEVHTYDGTTGAHVAGVLRRWRHARREPVHFVGLSATLRESGTFFSSLSGLPSQDVFSIEPLSDELEYEGQEYLVAVRADPLSGASVLSTTIQSAMLFQRALDPLEGPVSGGAFGQRLFVFTDDLDVTNRLYFDLLDAEGLGDRGNPVKPSLASLRVPRDDVEARRSAGQSWESLARLGHPLEGGHTRIGRTTSQDADVDRAANAIVATASLEVGFNDARVGAVLQHKSPRGVAAFLQRKGRGGRPRDMRPWTVVVLSDFGRDRIAYQSYEQLFDPLLPPRTLAVSNPVVVRMQAVFALMDWLAARLPRTGNVWSLLQRPAGDSGWAKKERTRQGELAAVLEAVLLDERTRDELTRHLRGALQVDDALVEQLYWQPPRPLLTAVIPTALRRLRTNWFHVDRGEGGDLVGDGPLPEFVISRLFGDLQLPEITVTTRRRSGEVDREEPMRAVLALNAYAPGRVSHRLTVGRRTARHWVAPPQFDDQGRGELDVHEFCPSYEELGRLGSAGVRVLRPWQLAPIEPPTDVLSSSYGRLVWESEVRPHASHGVPLELSPSFSLGSVVARVAFHTHASRTPVDVHRWAPAVDVEWRTSATSERGRARLTDGPEGDAVALGIALTVDGLAVDVPLFDAILDGANVNVEHLHALRVDRFRDVLVAAPQLAAALNTFDRERLATALVAVLTEHALVRDTDLATAWRALAESAELVSTLASVLSGSEDPDEHGLQRGAARIVAELDSPRIFAAVADRVPILWSSPDASWDDWAHERLAATVGAAFHSALQDLCPEFDASDVVVDLKSGATPGTRRVWLTESTPGGGGLLQEAARRVAGDPQVFFDMVDAVTEPTLDETVERELRHFVTLAVNDDDVGAALRQLREASGLEALGQRFERLLTALRSAGVFVCHPVVAAIGARFLRPGTTFAIDRLTEDLVTRWEAAERRLGLEIDLAVFAHLQRSEAALEQALATAAPTQDASAWRAGQITGLLWRRGRAVRQHALVAPNPFEDVPVTDVLLLRALARPTLEPVDTSRLDFAVSADGPLARRGAVRIQEDADDNVGLKRALLRAAASPVESAALLQYPAVRGVRRDQTGFNATLTLDIRPA